MDGARLNDKFQIYSNCYTRHFSFMIIAAGSNIIPVSGSVNNTSSAGAQVQKS